MATLGQKIKPRLLSDRRGPGISFISSSEFDKEKARIINENSIRRGKKQGFF
jgi:hypothetical protein